jgi:diaminopimelate epimerase
MPTDTLRFVKMHGAGNDYVYVDCFREPTPADPAAIAPLIADRHRGVGGDGLILVQPSSVAQARMRMFNADGSEAEMCGNGIRCVAHLVVSRGHAPPGPVTIETGRGVLTVVVTPQGPRKSVVRVDMGVPILVPDAVPVDHAAAVSGAPRHGAPIVDEPTATLGPAEPWWDAAGLDPRLTAVSMGNPHAIYFCRDVARVPLEAIGPRVERHAAFPQRTNVHFVTVLGRDRVRMRTWERGSGITQACGTGAAAVCVAAVLGGRAGRAVVAELPGGELALDWAEGGGVAMTGPAEEVFVGEWYGG